MTLDEALKLVREAGYVTLREKSYRQAQERQRVAEALRRYADEDAERTRAWAREHCAEERRLADRLTFVYGVAVRHGATHEELAGTTGFRPAEDAAHAEKMRRQVESMEGR